MAKKLVTIALLLILFLVGFALGRMKNSPAQPTTAEILEYGDWYEEADSTDAGTDYTFRDGKLSTYYYEMDGEEIEKELTYQYSDEGTLLFDKQAMKTLGKSGNFGALPEGAASMELEVLHIDDGKGVYMDELAVGWKVYDDQAQLLDIITVDNWAGHLKKNEEKNHK